MFKTRGGGGVPYCLTDSGYFYFLNKLASSKMRKLKADKPTGWQIDNLTNWQDDKMAR